MSADPSRIIRELSALQAEHGWLPERELESLATSLKVPLHRIESVSTFYTHFRRTPPEGREIAICRDLACRMAGAESACERLRAWARAREADAEAVELREVSCLGRCDLAPAAAVGDRIAAVDDLEAVAAAVEDAESTPAPRSVGRWGAADPYEADRDRSDPLHAPVRASEAHRVLRRFLALEPADIMESLEAAGLRGMGGAAFPTARKWSLVAAAPGERKHVVCNADESEPGTFKDRELLHDLPELVIEGMTIAARCIGASRGTVFIRHEYGPDRARVEAAIQRARAAGALGRDLFGSGFDFDVEVFVSPGGYVLGEETALLECMEGRRGEPRNKPPFPGQAGYLGRPTLINNVETFVHAVSIVERGADWWHGLGRDGFSGHKFVSVSGDVVRPGVSLFPMGVPLRDVLEAHGGMRAGAGVAAIAPGGASSLFLGPEALDLPLDFDALARAGSMLGSGAVVFVSEGRDLVDLGLSVTRFFRNESCGKCVPCRMGTQKAVALIEQAERVGEAELSLLRSLDETLRQTSICGLGQVALGPLRSILERFPDARGGPQTGDREAGA